MMPMRWVRRWPMWWAARRACARCLSAPDGIPGAACVVFAERGTFGWDVVDASRMAGGPGWGEAIEETARHPFDLAAEIPLRARLFRVAEDEHVLVAVVHHIAADGWSITPLAR